jgi:copper chaperone CopZ
METKTFQVPNIGCSGCVNTVESTVREIPGVQSVKADEHSKQVTVRWDSPASWISIQKALTEVEYPPALEAQS